MTVKDNSDVSPTQECAGSADQNGSNQIHTSSKAAGEGVSRADEKNNANINAVVGIHEKTGEKDTGEKNSIATSVEELKSDGSASAFEGTESIDSRSEDMEIKRKEDQLKNDPSGRSNY